MSTIKPLYAIIGEMNELLDELCDEYGEINEEAAARIDALEIDKATKVENCLLYIKNQRSIAQAIKNEEALLLYRRRNHEADAERCEEYLTRLVAGEKYETPRASLSWRRSTAVHVDDDAVLYWTPEQSERFVTTKVSTALDRRAIGEALKKGEEVPGAQLVERQNAVTN